MTEICAKDIQYASPGREYPAIRGYSHLLLTAQANICTKRVFETALLLSWGGQPR